MKKPQLDQEIAHHVSVISHFLGVWRREKDMRPDIRTAWDRISIAQSLREPNTRWSHVTGLVHATVTVLLECGWIPVSADRWMDAKGDSYQFFDQPSDLHLFIQHFVGTIRAKLLDEASQKHLGGGLKEGVYLRVPQKLHARMVAGRDYASAQLLLCLAAGGMWTPDRCQQAGYEVDQEVKDIVVPEYLRTREGGAAGYFKQPEKKSDFTVVVDQEISDRRQQEYDCGNSKAFICQFCGSGSGSLSHYVYGCDAIADLDVFGIESTNSLRKQYRMACDKHGALAEAWWLR
jgi:hypothetical protein